MKYIKYLILSFIIITIFVSCKKKEDILIEGDIPPLKKIFKDDFLVGAAIESDQLKSLSHVQLLKKHFNSITAENEMKAEIIHPEENKFDFSKADKIVKFAKKNNIAVRGHTLIWHNQMPEWFFVDKGKPVSKKKLKERMKKHITNVMKRYKGKIYAWDVVNEALDPDQPDGFRKNQWYEILGEEYIELAFNYARKADPKAKLFLNELDTTNPRKRKVIKEMIKKMLAKKIPIDGIGMQMHISLTNPSIYNFESTLKEFSQLGLDINITEMDITIYASSKESFTEINPTVLNEQGHRVKDIFSIIKKYDKNIKSVTFWGMADDHTWLKYYFVKREDWPLPFDNELKAKPFYWGMVDPDKLSLRTKTAKAIDRTITIDGIEEDQWLLAEQLPNMNATTDLKADIKASWDKNNLYILIKSYDSTPAQNDTVILFIDEKNDKSDTIDNNDYTIEFALNNFFKNSRNVTLKRSNSGYILEAQIPFKNIEGKNGTEIGLDVLIKNGENDMIKWNDEKTVLSETPKNWGILKFTQAPKGAISFYGTAKIDGVKDEKYNQVNPLIADVFIQGIEGEKNKSDGAIMKSWTIWDEKALYVYCEVKDTVLSDKNDLVYMQDSIEIFVDENNNKTTTYEKDDGQFRVSFNNKQSFGSTGNVDGFKSATKIIPGGYVVEAKIPFKTITAKEGTIIGFDLQVNDDQGTGKRDSIAKWNDETNNSWQNTSGFGLLIFKK